MNSWTPAEWKAIAVLGRLGIAPAAAQELVAGLRDAGVRLADDSADEMVTRWVPVSERPVPPEADTIIRTITTTLGQQSWSTTCWLDGLRGPRTLHGPQSLRNP